MDYEMEIAGLKRKLPLCKVNDDLYIAAFILFGDVQMTKASASALLEKAPDFDIIMTAEAKSIPLAYEMARQSGRNDYVVARKSPKVYMDSVITSDVTSITTKHEQTLCLGQREIDLLCNKKVLIVDDVISTGESMSSLEELALKAGGEIVAKMAVLAEGDSMERPDITALKKLPLFNPDGTMK